MFVATYGPEDFRDTSTAALRELVQAGPVCVADLNERALLAAAAAEFTRRTSWIAEHVKMSTRGLPEWMRAR